MTKLTIKNIRPHLLTLALLLALSLVLGAALAADSRPTLVYAQGEAAADKPLRLHILAHSDSAYDQQIKLELRDVVAEYLEKELAGCTDKQQAMVRLQDCLPLVQRLCEVRLASLGVDYGARIYLETADFPSIDYNGLIFAAGEYDALRVVLGQGQGHNWWCVLFPPLCFVDLAAQADEEAVVAAMSGGDYLVQSGDSQGFRVAWKLGELFEAK